MLATIAVLVAMAGSGAQAPPSDQEVIRALPRSATSAPFAFVEFHDNVVIVKNLLRQKPIGQQVFFPLLKPARVIESHWECTAYYTQTVQLTFPFAITVKKPCVGVVYMDKHTLALDAGK